MMDIVRFDELGKADFGWLQARHHFSFGRYYNPQRMGYWRWAWCVWRRVNRWQNRDIGLDFIPLRSIRWNNLKS